MAIGIDGIDKAISAVGHQRTKPLLQHAAHAVDQRVEDRAHCADAKAFDQIFHAAFAEPHGRHQRAHVAADGIRKTRVAQEHAQQVIGDAAFDGETHHRHDRLTAYSSDTAK